MTVGAGQWAMWWAWRNRRAVQSPKRQCPSRTINARRNAGPTTRAVVPTPTARPDPSCTSTDSRESHTRRRAVSVASGSPVSSSAVARGRRRRSRPARPRRPPLPDRGRRRRRRAPTPTPPGRRPVVARASGVGLVAFGHGPFDGLQQAGAVVDGDRALEPQLLPGGPRLERAHRTGRGVIDRTRPAGPGRPPPQRGHPHARGGVGPRRVGGGLGQRDRGGDLLGAQLAGLGLLGQRRQRLELLRDLDALGGGPTDMPSLPAAQSAVSRDPAAANALRSSISPNTSRWWCCNEPIARCSSSAAARNPGTRQPTPLQTLTHPEPGRAHATDGLDQRRRRLG